MISAATPTASRRRPIPSTLTLSVIAVGLVWLAARVAYFNGYYTEDSPGYVSDAVSIALGQYHARYDVNGLNIGTYAPVALPLAIFGKSEGALSTWPLLCSLIGMASIGGAAAMLFGRWFGVLAAFLFATYPGDVFFSTVVMPDAIQSGWLSASLFLTVLAASKAPEQRVGWYVAGGVAMGVCHLVRANGVLLLPVGVCVVAVLSRTWSRDTLGASARHVAVYLLGWASVSALEALTYLWSVGDLLFRVHVVSRHYGTAGSIARWGLNTDPLTIPYSAFAPLMWWRSGGWGQLNQDQAYHGLIFGFALASLVGGGLALGFATRHVSRRARAGFIIATIWFAWPLLYHQFGSQSLTQFIPIHRLSRHLVVYAPGAIVATVAGCSLVWEALRRRSAPYVGIALKVIGAGLLAIHLAINLRGERIAYDAYHRIKDTYSRIRERLPAETRAIVADPGDLGFFDFWLNPLGAERVRLVAFANYGSCDELTAGVVLTYSNPGWQGLGAPSIQDTVRRLPCLLHPPAAWRLLYADSPEKVYVIEGLPPSSGASLGQRDPP
jgi:4-amino-4-deoxy-L-arabinose transferase-like glycosyltransferase